MKLLEASFEQIYFTGVPFLNQRLSGKVLLEDGETLEDGWNKLKKDADDFHKKNYHHLYEVHIEKRYELDTHLEGTTYNHPTHNSLRPERIPDQQINPEEKTIGLFVKDIESCGSLEVLDSYKLLVKGKVELEAAYNIRRKQIIAIESKGIIDATKAYNSKK